MSMPEIKKAENPIEREQAVNDLIESVALVETGLSHVINAEGEKIQKVVSEDADTSIEDILKVNDSVQKTISNVSKLEMMLQSKLETVSDLDKTSSSNVSSGAIIPYNGNTLSLSINEDGKPLYGNILGFSPTQVLIANFEDTTEYIDFATRENYKCAFPMSRDGILNSFSASFGLVSEQNFENEIQIIARLYKAGKNEHVFYPINNAILYLEPILPGTATNRTIVSGIKKDINVLLKEEESILLAFYAVHNNSTSIYESVLGTADASINII